MRFVTVGEIIEINERLVHADNLRDFGLLDSAASRPMNYVAYAEETADVHLAAAHLLFGICRNHPFIDGNKRTALVATAVFYGLNHWELVGNDIEVVSLVVDVAEGILDVAAIANALKELARERRMPDDL